MIAIYVAMSKIVDICIISGHTKEDIGNMRYGDKPVSLEQKILEKLKKGWEMKGNPFLISSIRDDRYAQTMVKYEVTATVDLLGN